MTDRNTRGHLRAIACRPTDGQRMTEVKSCTVEPGRGIVGENRKPGKREVTLVSEESWVEACRELGASVPWYFRRANLLVSGIDLADSIGKDLCIGAVQLRIHGETKPCPIMDEQHPGLKRALIPTCRGGVHGEVLTGGELRVGDPVTLPT